MKRLFTLFMVLSLATSVFAVHRGQNLKDAKAFNIQTVDTENAANILTMTPKKYKELTGKKMTFKERLALKMAKKAVKKQSKGADAISKGLYVVLAIIGLGWLGMGINDNFEGSDWIIGLVLSLLFWLPGLIYSLVKMKKYY